MMKRLVRSLIIKVAFVKAIELKGFNFKVLHDILLCSLNLIWLEISDCHECDIFGETQTIEHLLYSVYVQPLWQIVEHVFGVDIKFKCILGLDGQLEHDDIIKMFLFFLYKHWLLPSLQNKNRKSIIALKSVGLLWQHI